MCTVLDVRSNFSHNHVLNNMHLGSIPLGVFNDSQFFKLSFFFDSIMKAESKKNTFPRTFLSKLPSSPPLSSPPPLSSSPPTSRKGPIATEQVGSKGAHSEFWREQEHTYHVDHRKSLHDTHVQHKYARFHVHQKKLVGFSFSTQNVTS